MESAISARQYFSSYFQKIIQKGGPDATDYKSMNEVLEQLAQSINNGSLTNVDVKEINKLFDEKFMQKSIHGHSVRKPFGYAGDFMVIDKIYQFEYEKKYEKWDRFILSQRTCDGIRYRKEYFKNLASKFCWESKLEEVSLLNVASGPARDLLELYDDFDSTIKLYTDCVEHDPRAIKYAFDLTKKYKDKITYHKGNIFKFDTDKKYDIVWSSGLFDYFDDDTFVGILKKFLRWSKPNAQIVLGNICSAHSLKNYMETLLEWPLHIRESTDLIRLAKKAGVKEENIEIGIEPAGIFLFLHITNE